MAFQGDSIYWVEVEKVVPNPFQPRREFDQAKLQELSESIRMYGVLQPLTVTRHEVQREDGTFYTEYELIAGERRLRASKLAGVAQVPVIIREGEESEQEKLELAIIENLQREDLNAVDRALAFKQLAEQFELSHSQVAKKVGRSREYVSNSIRLLALPEHMLESLKRAEMSEGHARTLLMLSDRPEEQEVIFKEILLKKMSVRETERIIRKIATDKVRKKTPGEFDAHLIEIEKEFTETLGTRVQILKTEFGGKLTIDYFSDEDLSTLLNRIKTESAPIQPSVAPVAHDETQAQTERIEHATPLEMVSPTTETEMTESVQEPVVEPTPSAFAHTNVEPKTDIEPESSVEPWKQSEAPAPSAHAVSPVEPPVQAVRQEVVPSPTFSAITPEPVTTSEVDTAPTPQPETEPEAKKEETNDDLYSLRNFSL